MANHLITTVKVTNNMGIDLASVGVSHKYSDLYQDAYQWTSIKNGTSTAADMTVNYNTGFLTTGRDWWYIVAIANNGQVYNTDPSNLRWLWDSVDKAMSTIQDAASAIVGYAVAAAIPTEGASIPVAAAGGIVKIILGALSNNATTEGYKQFFLENPDQNAPVNITLTANEVTFSSASGSTATTPLVKTAAVVPASQQAKSPGAAAPSPMR